MARNDPGVNITLSVLDRLTDSDPSARTDPVIPWAQSFRETKAAVRRDLEWLLNTRQSPEPAADDLALASKSVFNFGLPDITSLTLQSANDRARLLRTLETTITRFEPRIQDARVYVDNVVPGSRTLRFRIDGLLRIDPAPERVSFDTVLELSSGQYEVK
jgi:type VI secretion system protein ImpF